MRKFTLALLLLTFFTIAQSKSQFLENTLVAGGLSTIDMMGDSWSIKPLIDFNAPDSVPGVFGGGYTGTQPGMGILFTFLLNDDESLRLPVGIDYYFFQSGQKVPTRQTEQRLAHKHQVFSISFGLNYAFMKFHLADAKAYAGADLKAYFINNEEYKLVVDFDDPAQKDITIINPKKEDVSRLGIDLKLGIEGKIVDQWYLNINWAYGVMNLIGRSTKTGQPLKEGDLLTPKLSIQDEYEEKLIFTYLFQFLVQYKI